MSASTIDSSRVIWDRNRHHLAYGESQMVDPLDASRHPFETYLLLLATVSGVPLLFGRTNSGSMNETLPFVVVSAWGAMLVFGSLFALFGLYWRGRPSTGLLMERAGLVGVGGASVIYSAVVLIQAGFDGMFSACIVVGFGLACFAQARRISRRIQLVLAEIRAVREHHHD